jgi:thiamine biosynthesis lipoprotein ApbE
MTHPAAAGRVLQRLRLQERALSGSGIRKGAHIIDPRTARAATVRPAAWVSAPTAAAADALSTACMLMTQQEIRTFQREHPEVWIFILEGGGTATEGNALSFGDLPSSEASDE